MKIFKILISFLLITATTSALAVNDYSGTLMISPASLGAVSISGDFDTATNNFSMDPVQYQGAELSLLSGELLSAGTYNRSYTQGSKTFSNFGMIAAGNTGAFLVFSYNSNFFTVFMQWSVSAGGVTYTNVPFSGNNIYSHQLSGNQLTMDFVVDGPDPFLFVDAEVLGGSVFECTGTDGASVTVNMTSVTNSDATISNIDWRFEGFSIGSSAQFTHVYPIGDHTIDVFVVTNQGATDSTSLSFTVNDTQSPSLTVRFFDSSGVLVTSAASGDFTIDMQVSDLCDPDPVITGASATPVMNLVAGDIIQVSQVNGAVLLPTTGVRVNAQARDASSNGVSKSELLIIE